MKNPEFGEPLPAADKSENMLEALAVRRSTPADLMTPEGPGAKELDLILRIAARVPDHRRVVPFRFIIFEGEARGRFGSVLRSAYSQNCPDASPARVELEGKRFERAGTVVAVISKVDHKHKTPEWEQVLCVGAVCQNMLLAARATGFAAQWLTEWYAYDEKVLKDLQLTEHERIAGFVYIGTATQEPKERARPEVSALISRY